MRVCPGVEAEISGSHVSIRTTVRNRLNSGTPRDPIPDSPSFMSELVRICQACPEKREGECSGWGMPSNGILEKLPDLLTLDSNDIVELIGTVRSGEVGVEVTELSWFRVLLYALKKRTTGVSN